MSERTPAQEKLDALMAGGFSDGSVAAAIIVLRERAEEVATSVAALTERVSSQYGTISDLTRMRHASLHERLTTLEQSTRPPEREPGEDMNFDLHELCGCKHQRILHVGRNGEGRCTRCRCDQFDSFGPDTGPAESDPPATASDDRALKRDAELQCVIASWLENHDPTDDTHYVAGSLIPRLRPFLAAGAPVVAGGEDLPTAIATIYRSVPPGFSRTPGGLSWHLHWAFRMATGQGAAEEDDINKQLLSRGLAS